MKIACMQQSAVQQPAVQHWPLSALAVLGQDVLMLISSDAA
jgi:hypothetical protein